MHLDIRTLSYAAALVILVTSAATWYVYGTQRRFPGAGLWTVGMNLAALGFLCIGLRGYAPDYLSQRLGNIFLIAAAALQYHALARFNGVRGGWPRVYFLAALFALPFALGPLAPLTTSQRIVLHSAATTVLYGLTACIVAAHCRGRAARFLLGATCAITSALAAARGVMTSLLPEVGDFMQAGPIHGAAFLHAIVVALLISFGFLIMMAERLQGEIEAQRGDLARQNADLNESNARLSGAIEQVRTLRGILPICSHCKKIRSDAGYWSQVEDYVSEHTEAEFSHSLCPDCMCTLYGEEIAGEVADAMAADPDAGRELASRPDHR